MKNKKLLYTVGSIIAVVCLVVGLILVFNPLGQTATPEPSPSPEVSAPQTLDGIKKALGKLSEDESFQEGVDKYSQYLSIDESAPGPRYYPELVIPGLTVVGTYIEEGFFNKYFVSGYWETKDKKSENAIKEFLSPQVTKDFEDSLITKSQEQTPLWDSLQTQVFIPDPSMDILPGCAESWNELECFTIPPQIKKIIVKGETENLATYTAVFQMDLVYQSPNNQEGVLTRQTRTYTLDFSVENTNTALDNMKMSDIKIRDISGSLDIKNTDDIGTE